MHKPFEEAFEKAKSKEVELYFQEVSLMRQLIREISSPLNLLRELVSNAAAREVKAKNIWISCYPHPEDIYVFEVKDDGIGMDYSDNPHTGHYARLNKFLSLGLSAVVGEKSDEFGWKGIGSKLSFYARRLVVETYTGQGKVYKVEVNAPWETLTAGKKPKPKIFETEPTSKDYQGTKVTVFGHPPDVRREYTFTEVKDYLLHRTFVGFTRNRDNPPAIHLAVGNRKETLEIGFPVLKRVSEQSGEATRFVNLTESTGVSGTNFKMTINLKGLYTVEAPRFGLVEQIGNTGLILSVLGIPYFDLGLEQYAERRGLSINPGVKNCCFVVECDQVQEEMSISRSGINHGVIKETFDCAVKNLFRRISNSDDYKSFVAYTKRQKDIRGAETLDARKRKLERPEQKWVYWVGRSGEQRRIHREPENERDTLAVLWKLEALGALPFHQFESLEHGGSGADIIAHFRENPESNPERFVTIEAESNFTNYKLHGHNPSQMPIVICWDIGKSRQVKMKDTNVSWKFVAEVGDVSVRVFALARMQGVRVSREEM